MPAHLTSRSASRSLARRCADDGDTSVATVNRHYFKIEPDLIAAAPAGLPARGPAHVAEDGAETIDEMLTRMFEELADINRNRLEPRIAGLAEEIASPREPSSSQPFDTQ